MYILCLYFSPIFVSAEYFDQWVYETACIVGENVISTRLFSTLCTHRLRKAFLGWQQAARVSQAATRTQRMCLRKYKILYIVININKFSDRFFCKWQDKWKVRYTANNTLAHSSEVLVVRKWFDKWRSCLQLQILTTTATKYYTSTLLKKSYCFLTSMHHFGGNLYAQRFSRGQKSIALPEMVLPPKLGLNDKFALS